MDQINSQGDVSKLPFPRRILFHFFRIFFQLLYHQFAWVYDFVAWVVSAGYWQTWIQSVVPYLNGPRILEVGFGPGHLLASLYEKNIPVVGIDESPQMVWLARRRLQRAGLSPQVIRGEAQALPFMRESFNQVVVTFPAEYILKSATFLEFRRILIRGGEAVILPVAWIKGGKPWERLLAWLNRVTGEAPAWNPKALEPFKNFGLDVTWEMVDCRNSQVVIVHLRKE